VPLLLAAWFVQRHRGFGGPLPGALTLCLAAYAATVWLSLAWARDPVLGEERALAITKAFVIYALVLLLTGSREQLRQGAWTLVAAAAFVGGLGVFQALAGTYDQTFAGLARVEYAQIYGRVFEPRIAGPVGDPNFFAQMMIPAVPIGLLLAHSATSVRERVAAFGSVGVVTAAVLMTYSRGGALALGVVLVLWLLGQGASARRLAAGVGAIALLVVLVPSDFARRLTTFGSSCPEAATYCDWTRHSSSAESWSPRPGTCSSTTRSPVWVPGTTPSTTARTRRRPARSSWSTRSSTSPTTRTTSTWRSPRRPVCRD
jgi:hypothetical protein